jgi:hypothetical protein
MCNWELLKRVVLLLKRMCLSWGQIQPNAQEEQNGKMEAMISCKSKMLLYLNSINCCNMQSGDAY